MLSSLMLGKHVSLSFLTALYSLSRWTHSSCFSDILFILVRPCSHQHTTILKHASKPFHKQINSAFFQRNMHRQKGGTRRREGRRGGEGREGREREVSGLKLYFLFRVHCLDGHPRLFIKDATLLSYCYAKTPWPRRFINEIIWACSSGRVKVHDGSAEAWQLQQELVAHISQAESRERLKW